MSCKYGIDLDNRVAGGSVTMTDVNGKTVTETLKETALPEEIKNVSFYRIGVGSHKNQWINFDNIKTGYVESGFLGGTSYTKDGASVKADDVISCSGRSQHHENPVICYNQVKDVEIDAHS